MTDTPDIEAALRQERLDIARMLHAEATKHTDAALELLCGYYDQNEIAEEAGEHEADADLINHLADLILARTSTVAAEEAPELVF